jgi:hypothetical protein
MNNYLLIIGSHVDSVSKKEMIVDTLVKLKEEGVDVCYSTQLINHTQVNLLAISEWLK